jgi:hypothetical protein
MVMVKYTPLPIRANVFLTTLSGGEHQDHVYRLQPVSLAPSLISPNMFLMSSSVSFVQDISFRASLVCADLEAADAAGTDADAASGAVSSGAGVKRKRKRVPGGRELPLSLASVDIGGMAASDGREKALELNGSHFR